MSTLPISPKIPGLPGANDIPYILYYRRGNSLHTEWKHFSLLGDFRAAIDRGKKHCEILNLRFITVKPFLSNLTEDEQRHTQVESLG